jgi:hypothetical protein
MRLAANPPDWFLSCPAHAGLLVSPNHVVSFDFARDSLQLLFGGAFAGRLFFPFFDDLKDCHCRFLLRSVECLYE